MNFWEYFLHSNTLNFIVMVLFFAWIGKKFELGKALANSVRNIADTIERSDKEKRAGAKALRSAQKTFGNVETEIKSLLADAKKQAKTVAAKILEGTAARVKQIEAGVKKAVETEEKTISSRLTSLAAHKSVDLAKEDIIAKLKKNPKLHEQFIEESIQQI